MAENIHRIVRLGGRGDGVTEDGLFAPGTLPGEQIEGSDSEGRIPKSRILYPSSDRVRMPCPHAKGCGGCSLQHASDDFVAAWKRDEIARCLSLAGLKTEIHPTITSKPMSRRRAALSGRRLKSGALVGFHARASDSVVSVPNCHLLSPQLMKSIPALEEMVAAGGSRKGEVTFRVTETETGLDVLAEGGRDLDVALFQTLGAITAGHDLARLTWNADLVVMARQPMVAMGSALVPIPPAAFLQATKDGQQALTQGVLDILNGSTRVVDLFSGAGTFTFPLAARADVHAVEADGDLLEALDQGGRYATGLKSIGTEVRDLFRNPLLPNELARFDGAVIDPPRAGAVAQTLQLANSDIQKIAFVSCNPATFARDAGTLIDSGYHLQWVQPVDQFRWSSHIELVGSFSRDLT